MGQDTFHNGELLTSGFSIGKITPSSDVPVELYQYVPDTVESDPGYNIVINPDEIDEAELRVRKLSDIHREITNNGLNYETIVNLESIVPGIMTSYMPEGGFSNELSKQSLEITLERIDIAKVSGVLGIIVIIIGLITKLISMVTGDNKTAEAPKQETVITAKENETKVKERVMPKVKNIETKAAKSREMTQWLIDNKIGDIIVKHKRLNPSLVIDEVTSDPSKYFKSLLADKDVFDLNNILGNNMPNVFYQNSSDLKRTLKRYVTLYKELENALGERVDGLYKLMAYYQDLRIGKFDEFVLVNGKLLKMLNNFTGKNHTDERIALTEFGTMIKADWELPANPKPNPQMLANVISNELTSDFAFIINGAENIKRLTDKSQFLSKDTDIKRQMKAIANTLARVNDELNSGNVSEDRRNQLIIARGILERGPKNVEDEYRKLRSIIVDLIRPSLNAGRAMKRLKANVSGYINLTDDITHLFDKFEKKFGEI